MKEAGTVCCTGFCYEKDLYKKVRIHCVSGRTLPFGKAMKKIIEKQPINHLVMAFFYG